MQHKTTPEPPAKGLRWARHRKPNRRRGAITDTLKYAAVLARRAVVTFAVSFTIGGILAATGHPAFAATTAHHRAPVLEVSGRPSLGHGAEHVTVRIAGCARSVRIYASPESGDYEAFTTARWHASSHRWAGTFTFTRDDEAGRWYVTSVVAVACSGGLRTLDYTASFQVKP